MWHKTRSCILPEASSRARCSKLSHPFQHLHKGNTPTAKDFLRQGEADTAGERHEATSEFSAPNSGAGLPVAEWRARAHHVEK